jgi:hypothetical protein
MLQMFIEVELLYNLDGNYAGELMELLGYLGRSTTDLEGIGCTFFSDRVERGLFSDGFPVDVLLYPSTKTYRT